MLKGLATKYKTFGLIELSSRAQSDPFGKVRAAACAVADFPVPGHPRQNAKEVIVRFTYRTASS